MEQESVIRDIKNKYHLEASNVENQFNLRLSQELHQKEQEHKLHVAQITQELTNQLS